MTRQQLDQSKVEAFRRDGYYCRIEVDRNVMERTKEIVLLLSVSDEVLNDEVNECARTLDAYLGRDDIIGPDKLRAIAQFMDVMMVAKHPAVLEKTVRRFRDGVPVPKEQGPEYRALDIEAEEVDDGHSEGDAFL